MTLDIAPFLLALAGMPLLVAFLITTIFLCVKSALFTINFLSKLDSKLNRISNESE